MQAEQTLTEHPELWHGLPVDQRHFYAKQVFRDQVVRRVTKFVKSLLDGSRCPTALRPAEPETATTDVEHADTELVEDA